MGQRVKILSSRKSDGRYNIGKIIGMEKTTTSEFGYFNEKQFWEDIEKGMPRYKVAYVDCFTKNFYQSWFYENDLVLPS